MSNQVLLGANHATAEYPLEGVVVDCDLFFSVECLRLKIIGKVDGEPHQIDGVLVAHLSQLVVRVQVGHEREILNEVDENGGLRVN